MLEFIPLRLVELPLAVATLIAAAPSLHPEIVFPVAILVVILNKGKEPGPSAVVSAEL